MCQAFLNAQEKNFFFRADRDAQRARDPRCARPRSLTHERHIAIVSVRSRAIRRVAGRIAMKHEATFLASDGALLEFLFRALHNFFPPYSRIAIKLHMGEPGNRRFIDPALAKGIAECLAKLRCNPFFFDTPVIYASLRGTVEGYLKSAAAHGFTKENLGVPVIISNRGVAAEGENMTFHLAADAIEADGVLVLTHVKGHIACGMGGAIKNVGMGCVAKETKGAIHEGGEPAYDGGCTQCGVCVERCPTGNIILEGGRPRFGVTWCPGCSNCALVCPEQAIRPHVNFFDELLAESAVLAASRFKRTFAVNVLRNISLLCDCVADAGPLVAPDIGFVCACDMLTADVASLELLERDTPISSPNSTRIPPGNTFGRRRA
jgi:uncharacterized Fe-S center protein